MPGRHSDEEIVIIAQEISDYLSGHPNAADSLEGIMNWWLKRQRYEQAVGRVQKALNYLVARRVMVKSRTASGEIVYSKAGQTPSRKQ